MNQPIIETVNVKNISIVIQNVFKANFNDTYWLEEVKIDLDTLDRDALTWFDPFHGRSNHNQITVAIAYCSDEKFVILEKNGDNIKEYETKSPFECIISEDHNDSMLLAAHLHLA